MVRRTLSNRLIPLGEIVATHGIGGWLRLKPYNPASTALLSPRELTLIRNNVSFSHYLEAGKVHKRLLLLKLQGVDHINSAQELLGHQVALEQEALAPLGPREYYYHEVLGLQVFDMAGNLIGRVTDIWFKEGGDVYIVSGPAKDYLIPAVKEIVAEIDLVTHRMIIDPPEGLLDI